MNETNETKETNLILADVVKKAWCKVEEIAEKHGMTRNEFIEWSDRERAKKQITDDEHVLILAYQINEVIDRLEAAGKDKLAYRLEKDEYWIKSWTRDFDKVDDAIKHLTEVCSYLKYKCNSQCLDEWLLNYDDRLYEAMNEKNKKGKRFKRSD